MPGTNNVTVSVEQERMSEADLRERREALKEVPDNE